MDQPGLDAHYPNYAFTPTWAKFGDAIFSGFFSTLRVSQHPSTLFLYTELSLVRSPDLVQRNMPAIASQEPIHTYS